MAGASLGVLVVVGLALYVTEESPEQLPIVHAETVSDWDHVAPATAAPAPQARTVAQPAQRPAPTAEQYRREARRLPYPPGATPLDGNRMIYDGQNTAAFGYKTHSRTLKLVWDPGRRHGGYPNLIAGQAERTWLPAPGFQWENRDPQSPTVEPIPRAAR